MLSYQSHTVAVEGGDLHVGVWGEQGPVLLCSHGITASHQSFLLLAERLAGQCRLIAPDHRGRGKSRDISGPWGMAAHARDMVAMLDALNIERAELMLGHSMGAFITVVTQALFPERIDRILLVDGGLPLIDELPPGVSAEQLIDSVIGPAMQRLDMAFASPAAYLDFWRAHPAFAREEDWSEALEAYLHYDLVGRSPELRSAVNKAAIIADTESQLMSDDIPEALDKLSVPTHFLQAARGILDDAPLYPMERLADFTGRLRDFHYESIEDTNHYTITLGPKGADAVAGKVRDLLFS